MVYRRRFQLTESSVCSGEYPVVWNWIFWLRRHCAPRCQLPLLTCFSVCADRDSFGGAIGSLGLGFDGDGNWDCGFFRRKSTLDKIAFSSPIHECMVLVLFAKPLSHISMLIHWIGGLRSCVISRHEISPSPPSKTSSSKSESFSSNSFSTSFIFSAQSKETCQSQPW